MSLPRPLLILVIVLVGLGIVGCVASVGLDTLAGPDDAANESELDNGGLAGFMGRIAPRSQPVAAAEMSSTCPPSGSQIVFGGSCVITIGASGELRRSLIVRAGAGGSVRMRVLVTSGTETAQRQKDLASSEEVSVVIARDDEVAVTLTCLPPAASCSVALNP